MFDLNKNINEWKKSLHKNRSFEEGYIEELESHLRDLIEEKIREGKSQEEAFKIAISKIGKADDIGEEYFKSDTTNKMSGRPSWQTPQWMPELFWNYYKTGIRYLKKNKVYSFTNILGLAVGIAAVLIISMYIMQQLSYEKVFKNYNNIYRVVNERVGENETDFTARNPVPLGPALKTDFPEIKNSCRFWKAFNPVIGFENKYFNNDKIYFTDQSTLEIFDFKFIKGNPETVLLNPNNVLMTKSTAEKLFGSDNIIGKQLTYTGFPADTLNLIVTAVIEDIPQNTHIDFDVLISLAGVKTEIDNWGSNKSIWTYVELPEDYDSKSLEAKLPGFVKKYFNSKTYKLVMHVEPIKDIQLFTKYEDGFKPGQSIENIYLLAVVGFLILLIACANFINLSTAVSITRTRETGVRKTLGAENKQLIMQFIIETFVLCFFSAIISVIAIIFLIPFVNSVLEAKIVFADYINFLNSLYFLLFITILSILSGLYPAVTLSKQQASRILKNKNGISSGKNFTKYTLVVFQYAITVFLISSTLLINSQMNFIQNKSLGFDDKNIVVVPYSPNAEAIINELKNNPSVISASVSQQVPVNEDNTDGRIVKSEGINDWQSVQSYLIDNRFLDTYGIEIIAGRNLSKNLISDANSFLINESALKLFGWKTAEEAIGKKISWSRHKDGNIIGVVKDFHLISLHEEISPLVLHTIPDETWWRTFISFKIYPANIRETLNSIEKVWNKNTAGIPYNYFFIDESLSDLHLSDQRFGELFTYFSILSVIIACLGLFALTSFTTERRTKEIGIRKVLGASVSGITALISKEALVLVLISNFIAYPATYYFINNWLKNFAYQTGINAGVFLLSTIISCFIAWLSISYKAIKAATANPVNSLRSE